MTDDIRFPLEDTEADLKTARQLLAEGNAASADDFVRFAQESLGRLRNALCPADAGPYIPPTLADSIAHAQGQTVAQ